MADELLLGACQDPENKGAPESGEGCDRGGLDTIRVALFTDVNTDATGWDGDTYCITSVSMNQSGFSDMTFDFETARRVSTLDESTGLYTTDITVKINGSSKANWLKIATYSRICGLVMCVTGLDCSERWIGLERDVANSSFRRGISPLKLVGDVDDSGVPGEASGNTLTFRWRSRFAPYHGTVGANKPLLASGMAAGKAKASKAA